VAPLTAVFVGLFVLPVRLVLLLRLFEYQTY